MRTQEKFDNAMARLKWSLRFHNKEFWIVPTEDDYCISVVCPKPEDLPKGTRAVKYNPKLEVVNMADSSGYFRDEK